MNIKKLTLESAAYPETLKHIPSPPKQLYHLGEPLNQLLGSPAVAIVGTRKVSTYGEMVTRDVATGLAEQGVVIVSGLALGVDALAQRSALAAGGQVIAVLPSPLDNITPKTNRRLAQQILDNGGALVSEYELGAWPKPQNFIARNRIMSGLTKLTVITEAGHKSGALHTANFALDQGRDVLVIPGNVNHQGYIGSNRLIKAGKAGLITSYEDVLTALDLKHHHTKARDVKGRNAREQKLLDLILKGVNDGFQLLADSQLSVSEFNQTLTMLEISGKVRALGANQWAIS